MSEACRILRPGGILVAAALSRWARVFVRAADGQLAHAEWHQHTLTSMIHGHVSDGGAWDQAVHLHGVEDLHTSWKPQGCNRSRSPE